MRGSLTYLAELPTVEGSIPARAGEPIPPAQQSLNLEVYPRPCGGAPYGYGASQWQRGLSPPVRGSLRLSQSRRAVCRSIPARAGEPSWRSPGNGTSQVYPRPCGGAAARAHIAGHGAGLSPPVRGSLHLPVAGDLWLGSIPARAGEPAPIRKHGTLLPVYPRPCGGAFDTPETAEPMKGLSPPVRGSRTP